MATEAHVPGPGLPKPAPKKVATTQAHAGAFVVLLLTLLDVASILIFRVSLFLLSCLLQGFDVFRIGDWA